MIIPKGLRVTATSYEGDGDNYKETISEGLSEALVKLLVELSELFNQTGKFGNVYSPNKGMFDIAEVTITRIIYDNSEAFDNKDETDDACEYYSDFINDYLLGYSPTDYWFRRLDKIKIEYIPKDIIIEDVTHKFIK